MVEITKDSPIEVVLAFHDPKGMYSQHAGVVMVSIFEHTTSPVRVHILHDETLTDDNYGKFLLTAEKYDQRVEFHNITECVKNIGSEALTLGEKFPAWSIGMFFRLLIPEVLDVDRVIYLDCDVLVNLNIREFWTIDMKGNCLAGMSDVREQIGKFSIANSLRFIILGSHPRDYISSGVLMMDLKKIRELPLSMLEAAPAWFARYGHLAYAPAQDFINSFFHGSILYVSAKFQNATKFDDLDLKSILHVADILKSWNSARNRPVDHFYWQTYLKTAWGENLSREELIGILLHSVSCDTAVAHSLKFRVIRRLKHEIFHGFPVTAILTVLLKEARYWITRPFRKKIS